METKKTGTSEELDLGQLFQRIGNTIRSAAAGLLRFLAVLRRIPIENRLSFLGIIVISVALSILYSVLLKKDYYESTMIISSGFLNKRLVDNSVGNLDNLAKETSSAGLARVLNISNDLAENILGFEARPFVSEEEILELGILKEQLKNVGEEKVDDELVNQVLARIEIENRHFFEITIRTLSPTVLSTLQGAIVDYLRNNEYVKRRIEISKINKEAKKVKLQSEMKYLDSLKLVIYANYAKMADESRSGSSNVILSERDITSPVEIFNRDLDLYGELQIVNREIYLQLDFEVIDGFTEFSEPASPSVVKMALWALLLGVIVAYLEVGARRFNQYLSTLG